VSELFKTLLKQPVYTLL